MLAVMLLTSKGTAGVTGSGFVALAATLAVARWDRRLDTARARAVLRGDLPFIPQAETETPAPPKPAAEPVRDPVPALS